MKRLHHFALALLATLSLCASARALLPLAPRAGQQPQDHSHRWRLLLAAPQPRIYVREPLKLRATLEYQGEKKFRGALTNLSWRYSYTFLTITSGAKSRTLFLPWTQGITTGAGGGIPLEFKAYSRGYQQQARFSILFNFEQPQYVFEKAGTYQVKLISRLFAGTSYEDVQDFDVASNAVQVTVVDAPREWKPALSLWSGPEQARVMLAESYFQPERDQKQGLQKMKELIRLYPATPYAQIARRHLKKIGDPELNALFPEDKRLDAQVEVDFPEQTSFEQVLASLAQQSGVSLSVSDDLKQLTIATYKHTLALRTQMQDIAGGKSGEWVKRGDGYLLTRAEPEPDDAPNSATSQPTTSKPR